MKTRPAYLFMQLAASLLFLHGTALAHGTQGHEKSHSDDLRMKKLHAMMPRFLESSLKLESALQKQDATATALHANSILRDLPELKRAKPHKNIQHIKEFRHLAADMGNELSSLIKLSENKNFDQAMVRFNKVKSLCNECHVRFRD